MTVSYVARLSSQQGPKTYNKAPVAAHGFFGAWGGVPPHPPDCAATVRHRMLVPTIYNVNGLGLARI